MIARHSLTTPLALALLLAGCSTAPQQSAPPPPAMSESSGSPPHAGEVSVRPHYLRLREALAAVNQQHYQAAASALQSLLAEETLGLPLRRQALANQALLYLRVDTPLHSPKSASIALDELYRLNAQHPGQQDPLLLQALALALENALRLNKLESDYQASLQQQSRLQQNVAALEQALEKLRQLSLQ